MINDVGFRLKLDIWYAAGGLAQAKGLRARSSPICTLSQNGHGAGIAAVASRDAVLFIQRVYRIFSLLRFHRFYSKSEFWVKLSEISQKKWMKMSGIEWNWVKLSKNELVFTQFDSISLNSTHFFAKFHLILLKIQISSRNDENAVNWKCGKPVVWRLLKSADFLAQIGRSLSEVWVGWMTLESTSSTASKLHTRSGRCKHRSRPAWKMGV